MATRNAIILLFYLFQVYFSAGRVTRGSYVPEIRIPGQQVDLDPNDPLYERYAKESLEGYKESMDLSTNYEVIMNKVTLQVVAGEITRLWFDAFNEDLSHLRCFTWRYEKELMNKTLIVIHCKEQPPAVGARVQKDPSEPVYKNMAANSLKQSAKHRTDKNIKVVQILSIVEEMVQGRKIDMKFAAVNLKTGEDLLCHSNIVEEYWANQTHSNVTCTPKLDLTLRSLENPQKLFGGYAESDSSDPKYRQLAKNALMKYVENEPSYGVGKVLSVLSQAVAGESIVINFTAKYKDIERMSCISKTWVQSWINKEEVIDVQCIAL